MHNLIKYIKIKFLVGVMEDNVKRRKDDLNRHGMEVDPRLALVLRNSERVKELMELVCGSKINILNDGSIHENRPATIEFKSSESLEIINRGIQCMYRGL